MFGRRGVGFDSTTAQALVFKRHNAPAVSSFVSNVRATSRFCADFTNSSSSILSHLPVNSSAEATAASLNASRVSTAVCLVGATRTMIRQDVRDSFLFRFLAGWGIEDTSIFAVLAEEGVESAKEDAATAMSRLSVVASEWYEPTYTKHTSNGKVVTCSDGHEAKQLKQWSRCLRMIEIHEKRARKKFDVVIKMRPDDLWFGAMVPHCLLNPTKIAYISRQQKRWSDQWFTMPRDLAQTFLEIVTTDFRPQCSFENKMNASKIRKFGDNSFEESVFLFLKHHASNANKKVVASLFPRILSRTKDGSWSKAGSAARDIKNKCERFLWYSPMDDCFNAVLGKKQSQFPKEG